MNKFILFILILVYSVQNSSAQNNIAPIVTTAPSDSTGKLIEFLSAKTYNVKKTDSINYLILSGDVKIRQGKTLLYG
ncbi:MAG: hypothetical protein ACOVJ8_07445, partial [Sediminibacterium sp.]